MTTGWMPSETAGPMLRGPLAFYGMMLDMYADGVRAFWSIWGPFGEPVIGAAEVVVEMQRRYLAWLEEALIGESVQA